MTVYITGPISGMPDDNRKAFRDAAYYLKSIGHDPVNPLDIAATMPLDATWPDYLRADIRALVDCEAVYLLMGWESSRGACLEVKIAGELDMRIVHA